VAFGRRFALEGRSRRCHGLVTLVFHVADLGLVCVRLREAVDEDEVAGQFGVGAVHLVFFDEAVDELGQRRGFQPVELWGRILRED